MCSDINKIKLDKDKLLNGCMLVSIAHAIMVARYPDLSNEHSWDGMNYSIQDNTGAGGTITFNEDCYVGVFRDNNSDRLSERNGALEFNTYFKYFPSNIVKLAQREVLQYLLENINGNIVTLITTAIWGNRTGSFSNDTLEDFNINGGFMIISQIMELEAAFDSWKEYYDMTESQCELLSEIYKRRVSKPSQRIILTKKEIDKTGTYDEVGLYESRVSFGEIGIEWLG